MHRIVVATALACLLLPCLPAVLAGPGEEPPASGSVRIEGEVEVTPAGDAAAQLRIRFHPEDYEKVKAAAPDPRKFLQDMSPNRADYQVGPDARAGYNDEAKSVAMFLTELGAAKNRGEGRWEILMEAGMEQEGPIVTDGPRPLARFTHKGQWDNGVLYEGSILYALPAGAKEAAYDPATRILSWLLPYSGGTGEGRLALDFRTKDRLMATIYKIYGLGADFAAQWVAKTVWRNTGTNAIRSLKVRYRLEGYSEWSPWDKFAEVVPGQTVVSVYYPVLDASIAKLRSNTPAIVRLEWRWDDAGGRTREDDDAKKLVLLGVNEFVFSNLVAGESFGSWEEAFNNAPLLAAWVSRNDPVVRQFAAMANRISGGVGASTDDASAVRVLQACYDLLRANDFTYQHPPTLTDRSVSFDVQAVQNVKFPRDVIRDRSGTCIDLAILFAAMANAVGLDPYLALIPGHCFPFVKLPGGNLYAVETTGVAGGIRFGSADFGKAQEIGNDELRKALGSGRLHIVELRDNWTKGVSNPELEDFPPDILQKWGLREELPAGPPPAAGLDALLGLWGGEMGESKITDELLLDVMVLGVERNEAGVWLAGVRMEFTVRKDGQETKVVVNGIYENGRAEGGSVKFPGVKLKRTVVATGAESEIDGNPLILTLPGDGRIEALLEGEGGFTVTLAPKKEEAEPAAEPDPLAGLLGAWGGNMGGADIGSGVKLDEMYMDVARAEDGTWKATVKMLVTVPAGGGMKVVIDVEHTGGRADQNALRFDKVPWNRTVPQTGQKDQIEGNPLVINLGPDGKLKGTYEGADGMTFTLARR